MKRSALLLAAVALAVAACQTNNTTPQQTAVVSVPPAETEVAEYSPPPVGTVWTYADGERQTTWQRLPDGSYGGRPVMRMDTGDGFVSLLEPSSWNVVATTDGDGTVKTSATPHVGALDWPLWVGKEWTATRTWRDHNRGRSWEGVTTYWKVEAIEDITTPAGTFRAFRIQSTPGRYDATSYTHWYSPELGIYVKQRYRRTARHYLGEGGYELVLVEYSRPSV